uniref:Uncharacterized protein n=1 Tax=Rhizophora mucronata TaxID=61149 RepID=A0A2P2QV03_RHIMU
MSVSFSQLSISYKLDGLGNPHVAVICFHLSPCA